MIGEFISLIMDNLKVSIMNVWACLELDRYEEHDFPIPHGGRLCMSYIFFFGIDDPHSKSLGTMVVIRR